MKFSPPLQRALLQRRYKRFLADIQLPNGHTVTIHCPNTGSMMNCVVAGSPCWYSISDNPKRKYPYTWELASDASGGLIGINTGKANHLVREAIDNGVIEELQGYEFMQAEVKYGQENSRIDFLLKGHSRLDCYVEVKSVTLHTGNGVGLFPDSVSQRGAKHLRELMAMVQQGHRAVLLYCVQHSGIKQVLPARDIDAVYAQILAEAVNVGVEVLAYGAQVSSSEIVLTHSLPFSLE